MKYKVGDRVRIKNIDWYNENKGPFGEICPDFIVFLPSRSKYCGQIMTIKEVLRNSYNSDLIYYKMIEDAQLNDWTNGMIEGLVEESDDFEKMYMESEKRYEEEYSKGEYCHEQSFKWGFQEGYDYSHENEKLEISLKEGYQFKDENGNVINATKIVLEKKKKNVSLTQEQINTMVHDSCVLFCKHCGCGIPRETCTSLGTCKEHDEYRTAIRTCLMEKNKKK